MKSVGLAALLWMSSVPVALCVGCTGGGGAPANPAATGEARQASPAEIADVSERIIGSTELSYVSDYFSFVGEDENGHVAFAIDNNRGRDGAAYQAEHFVILHDEKQGFVELPGFSRYANSQHELRAIPDSPYFTFQGSPARGLVIRGQQAPLELTMEPIELKVGRVVGERAIFYMGSAAATLRWKDRLLRGRVIQEYLVVRDWNRMSRSEFRLFQPLSFQGFYLMTPDSGDFYAHRIEGGLAPVGPSIARLGFYREGAAPEELAGLEVDVARREQGLGLFRWPVAWNARWTTPDRGAGRLQLAVADFKRISTFGLGGFGMAIAKGTIEQQGRQIPVYGWAELILWRS